MRRLFAACAATALLACAMPLAGCGTPNLRGVPISVLSGQAGVLAERAYQAWHDSVLAAYKGGGLTHNQVESLKGVDNKVYFALTEFRAGRGTATGVISTIAMASEFLPKGPSQ